MSATVRAFPLAHWWEPAHVFQTLYGASSHAFWLDAGADAESGFSYLGAATERSRFVTASLSEATVTVTLPAGSAALPSAAPQISRQTIFDYLGDDLGHDLGDDFVGVDGVTYSADEDTRVGANTGGFRLGWVGWLGYELGAQTVGAPTHVSRYPDAALLHVDRALMFDHGARQVSVLALTEGGADAAALERWTSELESRLTNTPPGASPRAAAVPPIGASWRHTEHEYADLIRRCQQSITAGDAYQICLTNEIALDLRPDPLDTYLALRSGSPSHHGGLLRFGDIALLSASPEQFLTVTPDRRIVTKPIKGTRPRGADAVEDAQLHDELLASDKERAENLMIVDLMRNDLGRIAKLGTVSVSHLLAVESYAHVHQLVSTVEAQLADGVTVTDAVAACFPAGSMTGAPKRSAMTILDGLEGGPRGIYAGAFGYFGLDGSVDLAMVIRSIVLDADGATIGTGGGITALSDPLEEIEETRVKAAALLAALGVRV